MSVFFSNKNLVADEEKIYVFMTLSGVSINFNNCFNRYFIRNLIIYFYTSKP